LLPTSPNENELLRGFNPLVNVSSSTEMLYLGLKGSFCMTTKMPLSLKKTYHYSTLSRRWGRYRDWNVQLGIWGKSCRVGEAAKTANLSAIKLSSLLTWAMLNDKKFEISIQTAWV
jgi:hypothetical protein